MKTLNVILVLSVLIGCNENKFQRNQTSNSTTFDKTVQKNNTDENPVTIKFDKDLILNWDTQSNNFIMDENYTNIKNDKEKIKLLWNHILNTENLNIKICSSKESINKGDIAFLYLLNLERIHTFSCLKVQLDVLDYDCPYPTGLIDYIKNNRKEAREKIGGCLKQNGYVN